MLKGTLADPCCGQSARKCWSEPQEKQRLSPSRWNVPLGRRSSWRSLCGARLVSGAWILRAGVSRECWVSSRDRLLWCESSRGRADDNEAILVSASCAVLYLLQSSPSRTLSFTASWMKMMSSSSSMWRPKRVRFSMTRSNAVTKPLGSPVCRMSLRDFNASRRAV